MARGVFFYHYVWVGLAILLGGLTGCEQQEFVSNIEEMARDTLVYLTIECGVAMTVISSGCIIANELVATYNFCANRINWGSAIAARDGMEYHIESVVAGESMGNLAVVRVTGLGRPALTIGDSDTVRSRDKVYIAVHPLQHSRGSMIGKVTRTPRSDLGDIEILGTHSFNGWQGGIVLNYKGELVGIVRTYGAFNVKRGYVEPINRLKRIWP